MNNNQKTYKGKGKYFIEGILARFMSEQQMSDLKKDYEGAKFKHGAFSRYTWVPTTEERGIFKDFKKGLSIKDLMTKYARSKAYIMYSIAVVAKEQ